MSPPRQVVDLRKRDWRIHLKAVFDEVFAEDTPKNINQTLRGLK